MRPMKAKPLWGEPCNNCGACCIASQCPLSVILFGERTLCPALVVDGLGGYVCSVITTDNLPPAKRRAAAVAIAVGLGCDFTTTPEDRAARKERYPAREQQALAQLAALPPGARRHFEAWRRLGPKKNPPAGGPGG